MTVIVKIQIIRIRNPMSNQIVEEVLGERFVVGETIGDCLDSIAPDPIPEAIFKVTVLTKEARLAEKNK